jgi:putative tricarboxylic transport membrane protein
MMRPNNPTALSAVVGEELSIGTTRLAPLLKQLMMPGVMIAFASYLLVGIFTMRVPEGTAFPGPQFFPAIIAAGLYLFAALLIIGAVRDWRAGGGAGAGTEGTVAAGLETDEGAEPLEAAKSVAVDWKSLAWVVGSFLAFALLLQFLGWVLGAGLLFWGVSRGFGSARPVFSLIVGLTLSSLAYIAFDMGLGMSLPSGFIGGGF